VTYQFFDGNILKVMSIYMNDIIFLKNSEWHYKRTKHKCWTNIFIHYIPKLENLIISHKNKTLTIIINTKTKKQNVLKQKKEQ